MTKWLTLTKKMIKILILELSQTPWLIPEFIPESNHFSQSHPTGFVKNLAYFCHVC